MGRSPPGPVLLLDLGLPDMRRPATSSAGVRREAMTPIVILSSALRPREGEGRRAWSAGADDYLTKPFGLAELRARMAAVALRRAAGPAADAGPASRLGPLRLRSGRHGPRLSPAAPSISRRGSPSSCESLLAEQGRVVTKSELLGRSCGDGARWRGQLPLCPREPLRHKLEAADAEAAPRAGHRHRAGRRLPSRGGGASQSLSRC